MAGLTLYRSMARARAFELALADLWQRGLISGEMHLGTGEEAIAAGVVAHLKPGDAVALDHRPTPVLTLLGVDLRLMLAEMLGRRSGLCGGMGGHMHLFSREHLAASSGIVGAAGPLAAGFALASEKLRPGSVSVSFFGDGAANQGMLLESWNLAAAWRLGVLFVCKDNGWAITTRSAEVTGGSLLERAKAFGLAATRVDGSDVQAVHDAAGPLLERARRGKGPGFLLATCPRPDGHFLGDPLVRMSQRPLAEGGEVLGKVLSAVTAPDGGSVGSRAMSLLRMANAMRLARKNERDRDDDPLVRARHALRGERAEVERIDAEAHAEVAEAVRRALEEER
ncbi:MAG: thiamine pyrophosphate-dependent dehydrogenase E1 component subunit alpha [Deltaproteobacteria bacterium]|nr:thiamine pyrophosphate-dependent dehydrogenase E1 component subunit alpha [Deltaproteobacteria bacterium]